MHPLIPVALCCLFLPVGLATEVPYGHADFYPSETRPLGWRGDGTGAWPGASLIHAWDVSTGQGLVWKSAMPGAGMAQPLVLGEKVITTADPNWLICVNVHTGQILWKVAVDHTEVMPPDLAKTVRAERTFFDAKWLEYGQWLRDCRSLGERIKKKNLDPRAIWWDIKLGYLIHEAVDNDKQLAKQQPILAVPELKQEFDRLKAISLANGFVRQKGCNGVQIMDGRLLPDPLRSARVRQSGFAIDRSVGKRLQRARLHYNLWGFDNWEGYTTHSFATPCTDGTHIYVTTVNNAIGCYDLHGQRQWLIWDKPEGNKDASVLHTRYVASPLLVGGKLLVTQNSDVRVFDKRSGKKLWSIVNPYGNKNGKGSGNRPSRPTPEACSPAWTRLPIKGAGGHLDVLLDGGQHIYRLDDGKILSDKAVYCKKGATPICVGDLMIGRMGYDNRGTSLIVRRMIAVSRDEVVVEEVWSGAVGDKGEMTNVVDNGTIYYGGPYRKPTQGFDLQTGKPKQLTKTWLGRSNCSPIKAGKHLLVIKGGSFGKDNGMMSATVVDVDTGAAYSVKKAFQDQRIYGDNAFARRNEHVACGSFISKGSPSAQANRLFFRTKGYLWCIGDGSVAFPVPKDCPPAALVR